MRLREIARLCGASEMLTEEVAETEPTALVIDSRAVRPGDLFVAIPGEKVDGHLFVLDALRSGAAAAIVVHHRLPFATALGDWVDRLIFVDNTVCAMQQLAATVLAQWAQADQSSDMGPEIGPDKCRSERAVIGITGSAGKTTMKDLTAHLLEAKGRVLSSPGNLNTGYGLALTVARMICRGSRPDDYDLAVIEMGMSSYGEISRLTRLARPTVGVVGNVGTAHIEFFGTRERIARAKAEMVDGLARGGTAVLNADDPRVLAMAKRRSDIRVLTFGMRQPADVTASALRSEGDLRGTRFLLRTPTGEAEVMLPLLGEHNVANALAAATAAHAVGLAVEEIAARLASTVPSRMRGEVHRLANGMTLIDDSYNSNPGALVEAVRAIAASRQPGQRLVVVAGEMLELGAQGAALHRECGAEIAALGVDLLIGVRGLARELVVGAVESGGIDRARTRFFETTEAAASSILDLVAELAGPRDLLLVKGSRGVRMEQIVARLRSISGAPRE
ncbi:MAG: UDP-N-acetylmuramoyl-tripeptide--D-alanyl-D-alanine ligase [Acidobacteriota bacterium]